MPSRAKFLSTGLAPDLASSLKSGDECSICVCEYTNAVQISTCGHIFDFECITKWLKMDGRNSCSLCKIKLFDLDAAEDRGPSASLREQVVAALQTSRIGEEDALSIVNSYGIDTTAITRSSWQRATAHAPFYLGQDRRSVPGDVLPVPGLSNDQLIVGAATFRMNSVAANFVAMGNLIPALARAAGRPYDGQQSEDWNLTLRFIMAELQKSNGKKVDVVRMAKVIEQNAQNSLAKHFSDVNTIEFFFVPHPSGRRNLFREDLFMLLNYIAVQCWMVQYEENTATLGEARADAAKRRARSGPLADRICAVM